METQNPINQEIDNAYLSIIIPIYNEIENINLLHEKLNEVLIPLSNSYEVILINDGSKDGSSKVLDELAQKDKNIKIIHFIRNYGQTTAMMAGIDYATGDIIIPMDADLQNDPTDIPHLLDKLKEGYDVCSGWRKDRKDNAVKRNLPSRLANGLISRISGVHLHDYGCSLKAYKKDVIKGVKLYGEMHRFIPIYASWQGANVTEIPVKHHARQFGESKYGLERTIKVVLDLIVIKFLAKYSQKPIHIFGSFALLSILLSVLSFAWMLYIKFVEGLSFISTPLPTLSAIFFIVGFQAIFMGLIAEILMRTYYESQDKRTYIIKKTLNIKDE